MKFEARVVKDILWIPECDLITVRLFYTAVREARRRVTFLTGIRN